MRKIFLDGEGGFCAQSVYGGSDAEPLVTLLRRVRDGAKGSPSPPDGCIASLCAVQSRAGGVAVRRDEVAVAIGELSVGPDFNDLLLWGHINNRPFLRALHGLTLCRWREGKVDEAERLFLRILALNPPDNQGARFCLFALKDGTSWEDFSA